MAEKRIVSFIANEKLLEAVELVVNATKEAISEVEETIDDNVLDPFSALYESVLTGLDYDEWLTKEKSRQIQKTMQNAIGDFHQKIIGGIDGWEDLGKGNLVDVRNMRDKIVAEVKNKHNTVTGQHLVRIYDELVNALAQKEYKGFQGYYVTVIAKDKDTLKYFTPSDNNTHARRPQDEKIKEISGWRFYDIATGQKDSLFTLFSALPDVLENYFKCDTSNFKSQEALKEIFDRSF